ncbi:MAG TPA: hypothetical protein VJ770_25300 [Stellaceae bacterium]|nr:hypothetical protein [Stellaceae bacterium]
MGEVVPFPSRGRASAPLPPQVVFADRGWRILAVPSAGRFVAVSDYCRRGIEIGRFDPQMRLRGDGAIAVLLRCAGDEPLSRCAVAWLNSREGPRTAVLGASVVAAGGRFRFWRDAIVEMAAIGGEKLVRLVDGSVAIAREPAPVPLLDPFAPFARHRRRPAFDRLPAEMRAAVLHWTDPLGQFGDLLAPVRSG